MFNFYVSWKLQKKLLFVALHHYSLRLKKEIKENRSEPIKHVGNGDKKIILWYIYEKLLYRNMKYDTFSTGPY